VDVELTPEQPGPVVAAIESLMGPPPSTEPDPWWQAGLDEALET
jgi:hypothetical protein